MRIALGIAAIVLVAAGFGTVDVQGQGGRIEAWAPMPEKPNPFLPPHKPLTKLSDVLAKHKGQQDWSEVIVNDNLFHGSYISMAPGAKTPRRFHQDNRAFWIIQDGQIRFTIEGVEPFVATKGFLVQVPKRLVYNMETVGNTPSLRFEVLMANSQTMYPADEKPSPAHGVKYERVSVANAKGTYDAANVPFIDYNIVMSGGKPKPKPKSEPVHRRRARRRLRQRRRSRILFVATRKRRSLRARMTKGISI